MSGFVVMQRNSGITLSDPGYRKNITLMFYTAVAENTSNSECDFFCAAYSTCTNYRTSARRNYQKDKCNFLMLTKRRIHTVRSFLILFPKAYGVSLNKCGWCLIVERTRVACRNSTTVFKFIKSKRTHSPPAQLTTYLLGKIQ